MGVEFVMKLEELNSVFVSGGIHNLSGENVKLLDFLVKKKDNICICIIIYFHGNVLNCSNKDSDCCQQTTIRSNLKKNVCKPCS